MLEPRVFAGLTDCFARFEGELDGRRVTQLFSRRSLADRALHLAAWFVAAVVVFGITWAMSARDDMPRLLRQILSSTCAAGMVVAGIVQQSGTWHSRRWLRWNGLLSGRYRVELSDQHVDVQTSNFAVRYPYGSLALVDSGLDCVRVGLDATACRAFLLPVADCQPPRSTQELQDFIKGRRQDGMLRSLEVTVVSDRELPCPLKMQNESQRIVFRGPVRQGDLLGTVDSDNREARTHRARGVIYILLAVCFLSLLILLSLGLVRGRPVAMEAWAKLLFLGIFLAVVVVSAIWRRIGRASVQADPDAEVGKLVGWVSPTGLAVHYSRGYTAVVWATCDQVEVTEDRIVARFWRGDFLLIGQHMFSVASDFEAAQRWASVFARS